MADFCHKCSIEHFGEDFGDLANLGGDKKLQPYEYWIAICEGCEHSAGCQVDDSGLCIVRARLEAACAYPDRDGSKERALETGNG